MKKFSALSILTEGLSGNKGWKPHWQSVDPKSQYEVVIIGGGGHGLATAYYLAKNHNITNVAVLEKNWIGSGNTGRNTTIVRSNYLLNESSRLYEHSLKLWEGLSKELNYNVMFSQRGVLNLAHSLQEIRDSKRRVFANKLNKIDAEWLDSNSVKKYCKIINTSKDSRYPILGATLQRRAGTARHDAVAWGFARGASNLGVDICENCEVTGLQIEKNKIVSINTTKGNINTKKIGIVVAGHGSVLARMAGIKLPLETHTLQALVSEPIKPILDCVVMSNAVHVYVSQSDKGELVIGAGIDSTNSYQQRGNFSIISGQMGSLLELFPIFSKLKMLRTWGGIVDVSPDASPIIGETPVKGVFFNGGWGTGGFKATPGSGWVFAHTIANNFPHKLADPFSLNRFYKGKLIDEHGAAAVAH